MFCPKCGSDNPNDARFCGHCGGAMTTPASVPRKPGSEVTRLLDLNEPALTVAPGLKWGILAASLLLPIVGIVMAAVRVDTPNKPPPKPIKAAPI